MDAANPIVALLPELVLVLTACALLLIGLFDTARHSPLSGLVTVVGLVGAFALAATAPPPDPERSYHVDTGGLTQTVRWIVLTVGLLIVLVNLHLPRREDRGEFFAMLLFALAGVMLVAAADDLLLLFFALELVSVPTYVLVAGTTSDARAQESGVKYFFLGALSAALTAYGLSFLYGASGTTLILGADPDTNLARYVEAFADRNPLAVIGLVLALAGVAFKMAAVPFHVYAADVYQGAASPITGMLGFVPKLAGLIGMIKLLSLTGWSWSSSPTIFWAIWVLAALTMTVGNVLALMQTNAKRVLAYSSVAHTGYLLVAVLVGPATDTSAGLANGLAAALFYITAYGIMNLGAFAVLSLLEHRGQPIEDVDELAGLSATHPRTALAWAICLFSLMGMPPTAGFFGKVYIFSSALSSGQAPLVTLTVIGVLNAAVAAAYYLRMIAVAYLRPSVATLTPRPGGALKTAVGLCAVLVLLLGLFPRYLMKRSESATALYRPTADGRMVRDASTPQQNEPTPPPISLTRGDGDVAGN